MEKEINAKIFKDIVTKHVMFDNVLSMIENVYVQKNIHKTIDDYTVNGNVVFDFISIGQIHESDYFKDYDGSLYKDKKAPFMCAFMENLMKDSQGLNLALYYVEAITNRIMDEVSPKSKDVLNPNKIIDLNFAAYSGELIVTSHMTLPPEFSDIMRDILSDFGKTGKTINTIEGSAEFSQYVASNYGFALLNTNQEPVYAFQNGGEVMFGKIDFENYDEEAVQKKYQDQPFVTDDLSLILIDKYQMIDLIGARLGKPKAKESVNQFLKECPFTLFNVPSDNYNVKFTVDIEQLKNTEKNKDYPEIDPLFILRSETLKNELKESTSTKLKM